MNKEYKNLIFTKHSLERLGDRSISKHAVWNTINYYDAAHPKISGVKKKNSTKFIKTINDRKYHIVANYLKKEKKWLVISVWVRGEEDKIPFIWQLITLPFKIVLKIFGWVWKMLVKTKSNQRGVQ